VREDMHGDWFLRRRDVSCAVFRCDVYDAQLRRIRQYVRQLYDGRDKLTYNFLSPAFVAAGSRFQRREPYSCSHSVVNALASVDVDDPGEATKTRGVLTYDSGMKLDLGLVYAEPAGGWLIASVRLADPSG